MLQLAIVLLVLGVCLLIVELFMPGFGVFGIAGLISFAAAVALTVVSSPYGLLFAGIELAGLGLLAVAAIWYVRKKQLYGKLILDETLNKEEPEHGDLSSFMGKEGVTKTTLRPFGKVDFNGATVEVYADGQYISENIRVKVVDVTEHKITVRALQSNR